MRFSHVVIASLVAAVAALAEEECISTGSFDVLVVGAGLSGLSAAKDLLAAGKSVHILEARDRVGGRVLNAHLTNGGISELGAEFVGPTQDRVLNLISTLGLQTFDVYGDGNSTLYENNVRKTYAVDPALGGIPPVDDNSLLQAAAAEFNLNEMAASINVSAPWDHPNATEWDGMTFGTWLDGQISLPNARFLFDLFSTSVLSAESTEMSLLYVATYVASAGNETNVGTVGRLIGTVGAAQAQRVQGGTQMIAIKLAEHLGLDKITFNAPVRSITKTAAGYVIKADNVTINAKDVVVAMSPPLAARISYYPLLPAIRDQLTQRMPMGSIGKAIAVYPTPFWRKNGLNAQAVSDSGSTRSTFDNSPPDGSFGAIMGFIEADEMRKLDEKAEDEVKTLILQDLVNYFGPEAANITEFVLQRWDNEEFSRGGPVAIAPPNVLTRYGPALRAPFGGIHFAGTESATYWTGYMDGAIRSGERVAREILSL